MHEFYEKIFCKILCIGAFWIWWTIGQASAALGLQMMPLHPPPSNNLNPPLLSGYEPSDYEFSEEYENDDEISDREGSGNDWPVLPAFNTTSSCAKVRQTLEARHLTEAYMPRCLGDGEYAPVQCASATSCYCVNLVGQEIPDTRKTSTGPKLDPELIDCSNIDRTKPIVRQPGPSDKFPPDNQLSPDWWKESVHGDHQSPDENVPQNGASNDTAHSIGKIGAGGNKEKGTASQEGDIQETSVWLSLVSDKKKLSIVVGATLFALLCLTTLVIFLIFRLRKKDEGSYRLDEPKVAGSTQSRGGSHLTPLNQDKEFFA